MEISIVSYLDEFKDMKIAIEKATSETLHSYSDPTIRQEQAKRISKLDWFIQGQIFHLENMVNDYIEIISPAAIKVKSIYLNRKEDPTAFITSSDYLPKLYYELYAFVNLFRISLDYFHKTMYRQFNNPKNLPKSFSAFKSKTTNCPILERMANDDYIMYFKDFRDCLNHYKTFSANRTYILLNETIEPNDIDSFDDFKDFIPNIVMPYFRKNEDEQYIINFYLPDLIFSDRESNKYVTSFSYNNKNNILSTTMHAFRHLVFNYLDLLVILRSDEKRFDYNKKGFETAVSYVDFIG